MWYWSDGLAAQGSVELAAPGWISVDSIRHESGDARHQDAVGDGKGAANIMHDLKLLVRHSNAVPEWQAGSLGWRSRELVGACPLEGLVRSVYLLYSQPEFSPEND